MNHRPYHRHITSTQTHGRSGGGSYTRQHRNSGPQRKKQQSLGADVSKFINSAPSRASEVVQDIPIVHEFSDFNLDQVLTSAIKVKGYTKPTPIQDRTIPLILAGRDVVGIANTGSGKTGAFLIPFINKAIGDHSQLVLIIVPTRELAQQIETEFVSLAKGSGLTSAVCVGGVSIVGQIKQIRRGPAFVIGTPGRLKDLIERGELVLRNCSNVVLDEADRMLDMGFIHDMRYVLGLLPKRRHTLFFSATMSKEIERMIGEFLTEPEHIVIKTGDTSRDIHQDIVTIPKGKTKIDILHDLLVSPGFDKVLIFGRTKRGVDRLGKQLIQRGFKAESIHGDKTQGKRQRALDLFRRDHVNILVATDVAARGLDITGVSHVINFDLPGTDEDYIHRIGRTGRAGNKGVALTFVEET